MIESTLRSVPTAPGRMPLLGHTLALARDPLRFLESLRDVGNVVRVDLGNWPVFMLTTPELVREALVVRPSSLARGRIYDRARALFGDGLATSEGVLHRQQRRLVQPAFHRRQIAEYTGKMNRHAEELAASWRPGQRVAVDQAMRELTLRIVVDVLFATDLSRASAAQVQRLVPTIMNGIAIRMITPRRLDHWPIPPNRRFDAAATQLRGIVDDVVAQHRSPGSEPDNLLTLLTTARDADGGLPMSDTQLRDEATSLLIAGAETPATTLAWTFHELAAHPEVERRLHAEVDAVTENRPISLDMLGRMEYTRRVLTEVLRRHSVLLFTRRATEDTELGGIPIPAGTEIAYSPHALHRDPHLYSEPSRFDPDRWLTDAHSSSQSFNPFGIGHHRCVGEAFAWSEMVVVVAAIARRWQLRPAKGYVVREVAAEVPRPSALPMVVVPRNR